MKTRLLASLAEVGPAQWDALADASQGDQPFLRHAFLLAMETSACAAADTGWHAQHLTLWDSDALIAALPLYAKDNSYGEFVFDWAWADAYRQHGLAYYPKLLANVPFTPVQGSRLLARDDAGRRALLAAALAHAKDSGLSSLHILFPSEGEAALMAAAGMMIRTGVQFHWHNAGYADFADYLAALARDKRKKIRQERRRVAEAGVSLERLSGSAISPADWDFFCACYRHTYASRGRTPYLNRTFFALLGAAMPEQILMVVARKNGERVAASLCLIDAQRLYGRYWGALEDVPCLHFEACYYQPIEFAIERGLRVFEGGAQGEHKIARGLLPTLTRSAHWLAEPGFALAVHRFLEREALGVEQYVAELAAHDPFRP